MYNAIAMCVYATHSVLTAPGGLSIRRVRLLYALVASTGWYFTIFYFATGYADGVATVFREALPRAHWSADLWLRTLQHSPVAGGRLQAEQEES